MVELAISGNDRFVCSDLESERPGKSYTIETVREIRETFGPDETIHLILGSDNLDQFFTWRDPEKLLTECKLAIVPRPGFSVLDADPRIAERATVIDSPVLGIASSDIRERIRSGRSIRYLVPAEVEAYIREKNLYS
jgi:nicotinate-nucleotide adenylyltransferase